MTIDMEALKKAAQAATPGPWEAVETSSPQWSVRPSGKKFHFIASTSQGHDEQNARYIAAAHPATILALIAEVEQARAGMDKPVAAPAHRFPSTPEEVVSFIGSHYDSYLSQGAIEDHRFKLSVHDLLSAFRGWEPVEQEHRAGHVALIRETDAVFSLMLQGCFYKDFSEWQNGLGDDIGDRIEALRAKVKAVIAGSGPVAAVHQIPEGFALVPLVPTDDMIVAFAEAWYSRKQMIDDPDMADAYRGMLAAAPGGT